MADHPPAVVDEVAHWRDVHRRKNGHMLYAEDIGPRGTIVDFEIAQSGIIEIKSADGASDSMPWVGTRAGKKKLGLNRTNCKVLETITGTPDYRTWRGWITLLVIRTKYPDRASGKRLETDAIRIADTRPSSPNPNPRMGDSNG